MNFVSLAALGGIVGYAAFQRAGVVLTDWNLCLLAIGIVCALHFALARHKEIPKADRFSAVTATLFLGFAALQLAPLPVSVIHVLSPAREELINAAAPFTGGIPRYATLSATPFKTFE